ncbi:MAG: hypothetical protein NTZ14_04190 [Hyphomicrobiales bacterium]|nr:hypothetical protein [Hyphomicrobiales bacterium]
MSRFDERTRQRPAPQLVKRRRAAPRMLDADAAIGPLPGWLAAAGRSGASHLLAALNAGGALAFVHQLVSAEHAWAGTLRRRQALRCLVCEGRAHSGRRCNAARCPPPHASRRWSGFGRPALTGLAARPVRRDGPTLMRFAGGLGLTVDEAEAEAGIPWRCSSAMA